MSWSVRRAEVDDADAIARVNVAGWRAAYRGIVPDAVLDSLAVHEFADGYRTVLQPGSQAALFLAVDDAGRIGAFCGVCPVREPERDASVDGRTAEVAAIYADPSSRGTGAGHAVHEAALDHLAASGFVRVVLWVFEENDPARRFYVRHGWELDPARSVHDAAGREVPQVRYSRSLVPRDVTVPSTRR